MNYLYIFFIWFLLLGSCALTPEKVKHQDLEKIYPYEIVNFGEYHGTNEMPLYFFSLVKQFALENKNKSIYLGLEIPKSEEELILNFVENGNKDILKKSSFFMKEYQDGRASIAIIEALASLRKIKNIKIFCFDQNLPYNSSRDKEMAQNVLEVLLKEPNAKVFTHSGNLHPRNKIGTPWDKSFKSMRIYLEELSNKKIISIRGEFKSGKAWVCRGMETNSCGVAELGSIDSKVANSTSITLSNSNKKSYEAYILFEEVTASRPLKSEF